MSVQARERCRERIAALAEQPADPFAQRFQIIELLRPVVGFDRWCWPVCDPASGLGTTGIGEHDYWPMPPRLLLLDQRLNEPGALQTLERPRARDAGDPGLRFLDLLGPLGIGDELRVPLRDRHGLWGCLDLMRSSDDQPFTEQDIAFLDALAPLLAAATRRSAAAAAAGRSNAFSPPSAGVLVLDSDLAVRASTAGARAWLAQLLPAGLPFAEIAAMAPIYNVASRVFALATTSSVSRGQGLPARARVRAATGDWGIIEADRLDPLERTVAVTIRPAAAHDVLDLRLIGYDLTVRQRELVNALLDGSDTRRVSERLFVSPHTVNDHLKAIFDKVGVRTRKELIAMLVGQ
ncbi:MAG TPA: helix-turn-helix transcriptional regulator [Solirubrobacteraceae bacterium]|nr:helix-turn-helix transcriptional regulator [Solirubrobacteraceae bacterium]